MKRWQKAGIVVVATALLAAAARFLITVIFVWHFFFVAKCNPARGCEDEGTVLYSVVLWTTGLAFTAYFFFAFIWLFGGRRGAPNAP